MTKYAALKFNYYNIGCEIQSIASQRFLPQIDYYIFREQMHRFECDEKVKIILNNWYLWKPKNFPPSDCIEPLLVSMYFNPDCRKAVLTQKSIDFFKKYGPVGCRDMSTKKWFEENNIPAYYSSCLTSTLIPNEYLRNKYPHDYILCVECSDTIRDYIQKHTNRPVYSLTKHYSPWIEAEDRMQLAKAVLLMYQNAHCVVTTNLHTAMPCLAFKVPVCLLQKKKEVTWGAGRFEGMEDFFYWKTEEELLAGAYNFDLPPENPRSFESYRDSLIEICKAFTGFDANRPTLDDSFMPLYAVLSVLSSKKPDDYQYSNVVRTLYFAGKRDLLKMLLFKIIKNTDMHDINSTSYLNIRDLFK